MISRIETEQHARLFVVGNGLRSLAFLGRQHLANTDRE